MDKGIPAFSARSLAMRTRLVSPVNLAPLFLGLVLCGTPTMAEQTTSASEPKIETGFAEVNGTRLYYEVAGTGDSIVLIHGNFGDRRYYDGQFDALARLHRVLRYDIRGYGNSMRPEEGIPYSDFEDLEALMAHLDIDRAHIAGFSMGSAIAVDFCLAFPDRCSSLIAIGPWFYGYDSPLAQALFQDFGRISAAAVSGGREAALGQLLAATWWYPEKVPPRAFGRVKAIWSDYDFWHFRNPDPRRFLAPPAAEQLGRITVPALIITAEYDLDACRAVAQQMDAGIPDSTTVDLAGATHFMFIEEPEVVNAAMLDFLVDTAGR
jgi:pimeloyl-ACP methyl ester carboxylesterase